MVLALLLIVTSLRGLTSTGVVIGSTPSSQANALYNQVVGVASARQPTDVIVVSSKTATIADASFQRFVSRLISEVRGNPGVTDVATELRTHSPFVSANDHAALIELRAATDADIKPVVRAVQAANGNGRDLGGDHRRPHGRTRTSPPVVA